MTTLRMIWAKFSAISESRAAIRFMLSGANVLTAELACTVHPYFLCIFLVKACLHYMHPVHATVLHWLHYICLHQVHALLWRGVTFSGVSTFTDGTLLVDYLGRRSGLHN